MDNKTLVVFKVNEQKYCVDILKVKEICMYQDTIFLPNTPSFVEGIINLRGDVLCIINLAEKLGLKSKNQLSEQKIIVVNINNLLIGFLVDEVTGILHSNGEDFSEKPNVVSYDSDFINGIIKTKGSMIIYIDLEKVLNSNEILALENIDTKQAL